MSWEKERGPAGLPVWSRTTGSDGLPVWSGVDCLFDVHARHETSVIIKGLFAFLISVFVVSYVADFAANVGAGALILVIFGEAILILALIFVVIYRVKDARSNRDWDIRAWTLRATSSGLELAAPRSRYLLAERWAVSLHDVARVEVSPTVQWQHVRDYGWYHGDHKNAIPTAEMQAFLVLNDTSRRVVMTANADREGCSTLAHSLREYLEAARGGQAPASAAPTSGGPDRPASYFDL